MAEDFTTYTEYDPDTDYTITSSKITIDTVRHDAEGYVAKDKGSGHFNGDFEHLADVCATAFSNNSAELHLWCLGTVLGYIDAIGNRIEQFFNMSSSGSTYHLYIRERYGATHYQDLLGSISLSTVYYIKLKRVSSTFYCYIYSDPDRTSLIDTLSLSLHETASYRYIYGTIAMGSGWNPSYTGSGYIENLDLQEGGVEPHTPSDTAKASDTRSFKPGFKKSDTASASDIIISSADKILGDNAKALDQPSFKPKIPISDNAKASDFVSFVKAKHISLNDTAKASDFVSFNYSGIETHYPTDTAKASDSISFKVFVGLEDNAKASDSLSFVKGKHISIGDTAKASDLVSFAHPITTPSENIVIGR